ncbi:MAG: hypothetical protein FOGNACKC_01405 [Anaerolineae bacterium]|nr:hypothetical protein [Anaerolineae bacterium]
MTNVTINIQNNCGCGCGDSSGGGSGGAGIIDVPWEEIPSPTGPEGPPAGYLQGSSLSDRQCRSAVFNYSWLYYLTDNLANTTIGRAFLDFATSNLPGIVKTVVLGLLFPLITAVIEALTTAGIEISDIVLPAITFVISSGIYLGLLYLISTYGITENSLQDILTKLPAAKDNLICALAKAPDAAAAKANLEQVVSTPAYGFTSAQQNWIIGICATMAPLLYYTPEWWPSFDTETLASISPNCCGTFVEGALIGAGSDEGCQTAWYIVDQLVAALNGVQNFYNWYWNSAGINWNLLDNDAPEITDILAQNASTYIPAKVLSKAPNRAAFHENVGNYIGLTTRGLLYPLYYADDYNWQNAAAYLTSQAATLRTGLRNALDVSDCYAAVSVPLFAWIDANVDADLKQYMKTAIDGLIKPLTGRPGILNLMFYQDADVAFYAVDDCTGGGDPAGDYDPANCTDTGIYDFTTAQYNWTSAANGNWAAGVGFSFNTSGIKQAEIVQQVRHSPASIKLTWNANESGRPIYVYVSDNGTDWTEHTHLDFQPTGTITLGGCIVGKYIKIVIFFWQASWAQISKVEFA